MEQLLEQPQLVLATHERRLERIRSASATHLRDHPDSSPRGHRSSLALEGLLTGGLVVDGLGGGPLGRLPDQDRARRCYRLEPAGGVDEVACDHALADRTERDRRFAGHDTGPGLDTGAQDTHRVHQIEAGPYRPLGVVLVRRRRSPDRHDRVADELLDRAAIAVDDVARQIEVPAQQLARVLRVVTFGERGEPDQVGEQDRDQPALSDGGCISDGCARAETAGGAAAAPSTSGVAHSPQKRMPGSLAAPQAGQGIASNAAQPPQNLRPGRFSVPQFEQTMCGSDATLSARG